MDSFFWICLNNDELNKSSLHNQIPFLKTFLEKKSFGAFFLAFWYGFFYIKMEMRRNGYEYFGFFGISASDQAPLSSQRAHARIYHEFA